MYNRTHLLTPLVALAVMLILIPLSGCRSLISLAGGAPPSVDAVVMCRGVDSDGAPVNPTTTFSPDTPEIFCSVKLSNAPANSRARAEWIYREGELEGVRDYLIDMYTITTEGTRYIYFSLSIPDDGWPQGIYELVLYMNDKRMEAVPFTVSGTAPVSTPAPQDPDPMPPPTPTGTSLTEVTMARDVASNHAPISPTSTFDAGTPTVYTTMLVSGAPQDGVMIRAEWYDMGPSTPTMLEWHEIEVGDGYAHFYYTRSNGWPAGDYAIWLYVDGDLRQTVPYSVTASGLQVTEATMARDVDSQNRPVNPTTVFSSNATYIYCSVYIGNRPSATHAQFDWYYLHGSGLNLTNHLYATGETTLDNVSGYEWFRLNPPSTGYFPQGEYAFILYLDGEEEVFLTFTVQ